ncbi:MAG: response regulator transcription factor [Actinomycetota bacterium]
MKPRAVIVEVDDVIAGMICYFLELQGIACSAVATAEAGLDLVASTQPDMAIVDDSLPGHDGWWLVETLRSKEEVPRLPVVLLTVKAENAARATSLACECLRKPFSYDQLNERLNSAARLAHN